MLDIPIVIVRSRAISGSELVEVVQRIRDCCRRHDFVSRTHGEIHSSPMKARELPSLGAYQRVIGITLRSAVRDSSKCNAFVLMTRMTQELSERHAWTTWHVAESSVVLEENDKYDLNVSAGLRTEGYFSGVYVFRPSPAIDDLLLRAAFFQRAISEVGQSEDIRVLMDGDVLRMAAQEPWKLSFPSARTDGSNPSGFYASGFAGIGDAMSAGESLVERFAKRVLGVSFVAKLLGEGYNKIYRDLSALGSFWDIEVMGAFTLEAVDILKGGEISNTSPSRIPAFEWYGARDWAAYGAVVVENGQRFLEIAISGMEKQIPDRLAFLNDLKFESI